jgi:ScaI-like restriction endonuclease
VTHSPYRGTRRSEWPRVTRRLVQGHPLQPEEIVEVVLHCWDSIFASSIGTRGFRLGADIFPKPQIVGFLLHELIPLELQARHPGVWRADVSGDEKDLVYIPDTSYSIELKTSSNPKRIFGNRSYAQEGSARKKARSGYYLAVNFQKFT